MRLDALEREHEAAVTGYLRRLAAEPAPARQPMPLAWAGAGMAERVLAWPLTWLAPEQAITGVLAVFALAAAASFSSLWPLLAGAEE